MSVSVWRWRRWRRGRWGSRAEFVIGRLSLPVCHWRCQSRVWFLGGIHYFPDVLHARDWMACAPAGATPGAGLTSACWSGIGEDGISWRDTGAQNRTAALESRGNGQEFSCIGVSQEQVVRDEEPGSKLRSVLNVVRGYRTMLPPGRVSPQTLPQQIQHCVRIRQAGN